jgi:hypothetical protein
LGLIVATLIHAAIEIVALQVIFGNPERFVDTVWWQHWHEIHWYGATLLWLLGFGGGIYLGFRFWRPYGCRPGAVGFKC